MEEITVNGIPYVPKSEQMADSVDGLRPVLIRSYSAGVHFGLLKEEKFTEAGKVVTLVKTRRVWYWSGAASLSQMALEGVKNPSECKFSVEIAENEIVNVVETMPLTKAAYDNLKSVEVWKN